MGFPAGRPWPEAIFSSSSGVRESGERCETGSASDDP